MTVRFAHANLRALNGPVSVEFYKAVGLKLTGCLVLNESSYLIYLGAEGEDVGIELTVNEAAPEGYDRSPGSGHVALTVGSLNKLLSQLAKQGIKPEGPPFNPGGRQDVRICFVRDPDGHRVELIEGSSFLPKDPLPSTIGSVKSIRRSVLD